MSKPVRGRPFPKGVSGNPGGRPKIPQDVKDAIRAACPEAVQRLIGYMGHENANIAMWAITELLNRGYGKPVQEQTIQMDVTGVLHVRHQVREILLERESEGIALILPDEAELTLSLPEEADD